MSTFADALAETAPRKGPQCSVCQLEQSIEGHPEQAVILDALASGQLNHVARALAKFTGDQAWVGRGGTIGRHRRAHLAA